MNTSRPDLKGRLFAGTQKARFFADASLAAERLGASLGRCG